MHVTKSCVAARGLLDISFTCANFLNIRYAGGLSLRTSDIKQNGVHQFKSTSCGVFESLTD